jgi:putative PIN family toxin of toxin-antitoxin system
VELVRTFFDANILISAIVYDGNELEAILRSTNAGHTIVISDHIEEEIFRVMLEKFPEHSKLFHEFIRMAGFEVVPREIYINNLDDYNIVRDKHDRHVLACADITKCNVIVSGDKDLYELKEFKNIQILKSTDYLKMLK